MHGDRVGFIYINEDKILERNLPKTVESMVTWQQVLGQNMVIVSACNVGCPLCHGGYETEFKEGDEHASRNLFPPYRPCFPKF